MNSVQGVLIIEDIPDEISKEKVRKFLLNTVKNSDRKKVDSLLDSPPVTLGGRISKIKGKKLAQKITDLGAKSVFVERQANPHQTPPQDADCERQRIQRQILSREGTAYENQDHLREPEKAVDTSHLSEKNHEQTREQKRSTELKIPEDDIFKKDVSSQARPLRYRIADQVAEANKELWIIFTMVAVAGLMNYLVTSQYMILGLYSFPTIMSAYFYGRRHAVMTALLTIIIVGVMVQFNDVIFSGAPKMKLATGKWYHMMAWGSVLICTAYAMGTLYERHVEKVKELRKTYQGLIVILRHFISKDQYTENHCYRVSVYASKIAAYLGLDDEAIEDIRSAALLHDIGKLKVSRELLYKAARLSDDEYREIKKHVSNGAEILEPLKGPLGRIIPIILAHHDKYDGNGYRPNKGEGIPLGARILAVADVYDALTSDRPYRKAMAPLEAKEIIVKGSGTDFDPAVVKAFLVAFERGEMDVPSFVV